jgi:hypothetical protein
MPLAGMTQNAALASMYLTRAREACELAATETLELNNIVFDVLLQSPQ